MPSSQEFFASHSGRRRVLVVEDESVNRDILASVLRPEFEVLLAEDGREALARVGEYGDTISLILLDLIMPNMPGQEVLRRVKDDPATRGIPVIVASGDRAQEIACLQAGAADFIQKPYPEAGVIRARVRRAIELSEDREILRSTERDPLTGLYNREFFLSYAAQFDHFHPRVAMDAIVLDINRFSILAERHGRTYADAVLRRVGERVREMVHSDGGLVCRGGTDVFLVYCPHREDYKALLENASAGLNVDEPHPNSRVRLRMGVYSNVDKSVDVERRFHRARAAADSVRSSYTRSIGIYDERLYKSEAYAERLLEDFPRAIAEGQFKVYYQPKYDVRPDLPVLSGAEGLVRWDHPDLGMLGPGVFIPLFEENGLIQELDHYVWREALRQIRAWKDTLGTAVPVSVNISRVDMYDPSLIYYLQGLLEQYELLPQDLRLEVTESAYAEDARQIIEMVKKLRLLGHQVEMDDFGTGYSSLNMLSEMPVDCLKLDMKFVRSAFAGERDTHMLEVILDIAGHLHVPVVAEGVETIEQLEGLREIGCAFVQGYFFSPPVPPEQFAALLTAPEAPGAAAPQPDGPGAAVPRAAEQHDESRRLHTRASQTFNISMSRASVVFVLVAALVAGALFLFDWLVTREYLRMEQANEHYIAAREAASSLELASDYLTSEVRSFVVTGSFFHLENYFTEAEDTRRRDIAVETLEELMDETGVEAYTDLSEALKESNALMALEYHAMRLVLDMGGYDMDAVPEAVRAWPLTPEEHSLPPEGKRQAALALVFGQEYAEYKDRIFGYTSQCTEEIITRSEENLQALAGGVRALLNAQSALTVAVILVTLVIVGFIFVWVKTPLMQMVRRMRARKTIPPAGAKELRYVSETYNEIYEENRRAHERLNYGATHDALTGLYNRSAYDLMSRDMDQGSTALMLIDVDKFKTINDTYGHDVGDMVLVKVADTLRASFRSTDLLFRLGGDEFVAILTRADSSRREEILSRIEQINQMLQNPAEDVPPVSLSVGVAFSDRENPEGTIFRDADTALYRAKSAGRCCCVIY